MLLNDLPLSVLIYVDSDLRRENYKNLHPFFRLIAESAESMGLMPLPHNNLGGYIIGVVDILERAAFDDVCRKKTDSSGDTKHQKSIIHLANARLFKEPLFAVEDPGQPFPFPDVTEEDLRTAVDVTAICFEGSKLYITIHPEMGYSIKSKLGGDSTLINSNKDASNFIFRIEGIDDAQMEHVNSLDKFKKKFEFIKSVGGSWHFEQVSGSVLRDNLTLLDLGLAKIIASCMEKYYTGQSYDLAEITRMVSREDPLCINNSDHQPMYEYKMKQFLLAFALGMTVSSPWYGTFNANGGYIVVKEDGDVICYHFFDRNDLENYLFNNTRFDTPSTSRHDFGQVYKSGDNYYIKLNLLVRFVRS